MADSYLTINGLRLDVDGFCRTRDFSGLLDMPTRGENFVSLGVAGSTARPAVLDQIVAPVGIIVFGQNDENGTPHANPHAGLDANLDTIKADLVTASLSTTVTATITWDSGATKTGSVQVRRFQVGLHAGDLSFSAVACVFDVIVPAGALT